VPFFAITMPVMHIVPPDHLVIDERGLHGALVPATNNFTLPFNSAILAMTLSIPSRTSGYRDRRNRPVP